MKTEYDQLISNALRTDPIAEAEVLVGSEDKNDPVVNAVGFTLMRTNMADRDRLMKLTDDTTHSMELGEYLRVVSLEGFEPVLTIPFVGREQISEEFRVLFSPADCILLSFDTYGGDHVNGGNFYYNWKPTSAQTSFGPHLSSGSWTQVDSEWIWAGYHDCREALRFHLRQLRTLGSFVNPWLVDERPWMCHYMDTDGGYQHGKYDPIIQERLAMLPDSVRKAIRI